MTKMIKMSLIASVAVTGMTSTVCAQPLEDAIKGVDVSGMMRFRYDEVSNKGVHSAFDAYRLEVKTKSKVNEIVTANVTVGINGDTGADVKLYANQTEIEAGVSVRDANFAAALGFATVIAGKQSIPGPFVDNTSDDISRGTGVVALIPAGPVTIAAGHFNNHNIKKAMTTTYKTDVEAFLPRQSADEVAIIGSVAGVNFDAWYATVSDTLSAVSIGAKTTVSGVTVDARHSSLDMSKAYTNLGLTSAVDGQDTSTLTKVVASTKVGPIALAAGYATTGKENGKFENRMAIDGDNDAQSDLRLWQASAGQLSDASAMLVTAGMEVMPSVTANVKYLTVDFGTESQAASEKLAEVNYAMSKNLSIQARFSNYIVKGTDGAKTTDSDMGRLEIKYTF